MQTSIPLTPQELFALQQQPIDAELIARAIAGVIHITRSQGQSLQDLTTAVLTDHQLLDPAQRHWLSEMVANAWDSLP